MSRPLHIAIDLRLAAYQAAGIARYATELWTAVARIADPAEWRLTALLARRDGGAESRFGRAVTRRTLVTPPHHRLEQWTLPLELLPLGLDLLHSPDFVPPFKRRCRAVATVHDLAFLRDPTVMTAESRRHYRQVFRAVRRADRVIVPSESTRRDAVSLLGALAGRLRVIPEAPADRFRPLDEPARVEARRRWAAGERYALFVGTREPRKNLRRLLEAWASLPALAERDAVPLLIAGGTGWLTDDLESVARALGLGGRVRWLGRVPDDDLPALFGGADLFVYPSLYEGFGLPVLEAMACGTPVVTSAVASLPEVAGGAAVLVEPTDVGELARACAALLDDAPRRAELRERGLRQAARFSWEKAARATLGVYEEALGGRR